MKRRLLRVALWGGSLFLVLVLLFGPGLFSLPIALLMGWFPSAVRLLRAWHPDAQAVALFSLAALLLLGGSHAFLNWLFVRWRSPQGAAAPLKWPWKWTVCAFGILFCTLLAIGSLILTTHQLYWMAKSPDPVLSDPFRERIHLLAAAMNLRRDAEAAHWDTLKTREAFWQGRGTAYPYAPESLQAVWVEQDTQHLRAVVLIPRRPLHRDTAKFSVLQPGRDIVNRNLEELPLVLAAFGIQAATPAAPTQPNRLP